MSSLQTPENDSLSSLVNQPSTLQPFWTLPLRLVPATRPVDNTLINLVQRQRDLALSGANIESVLGPYQPSIKALVYPDHLFKVHPVASAFSHLLHETVIQDLPVKMAVLFHMTHLVQWQIALSEDAYKALPDWHIPMTSQLLTPHPVWVSHMLWPKLRNRVVERQDLYANDEFLFLYTSGLNSNWPYSIAEALHFESADVRISEVFERHVLDLDHWSLDILFTNRYPELRDLYTATRTPAATGEEHDQEIGIME